MSLVTTESLFVLHHHRRRSSCLKPVERCQLFSKAPLKFSQNCTPAPAPSHRRANVRSRRYSPPKALSSPSTAVAETSEASNLTFSGTFDLKRHEKIEGKITVRLENGKDKEQWSLIVGCSLPGKWALHWGVNYIGDAESEWDQPPEDMRPPDSVPIKDYAIETPLKKSASSSAGDSDSDSEVKIDFTTSSISLISAIYFVLKDEETGRCYQHKGGDFKVSIVDYVQEDDKVVGAKSSDSSWTGGALGQISNLLLKTESSNQRGDDVKEPKLKRRPLQGFYEEHSVSKELLIDNLMTVSVRHSKEEDKNELYMETDLPGDVVVHWGVCRDEVKNWEVPEGPYPPETITFKNKALRTRLQQKKDGRGSSGSFIVDGQFSAFVFALKLDNNTWLNFKGDDFRIPVTTNAAKHEIFGSNLTIGEELVVTSDSKEVVSAYANGILNEINKLVSGISTEKGRKTKSRKAQELILEEIEKLAAEAYSIFRSSTPIFTETEEAEDEDSPPPAVVSSGTGSGFEILCQGFNWESHKSGRWYLELQDRASELAAFGFSVIWLPPPTDSVSPEGYMPRDLYNLNSRYGNMDQLKSLVNRLHDVGIKVLGDVVLNHRCAQFQNQNGVWNIFGGRLNWDDHAVVCDDPHFQGRGNKSSGDCFHAAPNIDHSQEFVRKDIKEWLCWLREEVGYDGWRLDFARGFWGGYVKDYLEASDPYFAVGEFWDSLSYTYGEMDRNQDAHRQRIIDWINATNGAAGAFDVTTKGVLHCALEKCEYWRLADEKGKPPGVLGWWPSRAVTFIENHDTGSTQGHWRFPGGKEMQGYAYILTHPGTPSVFYDHLFADIRSQISELISIRKRNKIHCRSAMKIMKAENDVYAAMIDEKLAMKIGPGHYEPSKGSKKNWSLAMEGRDYKVWEASK